MESNIFNELDEKYREFKSNLKGGIGEFAAALALKYDVSEKIHIIRNVYVPLSDGKTAEIDLVIVHTTGIYVVECKKLQRLDIRKRKQQNVDADVCKRTEISVF